MCCIYIFISLIQDFLQKDIARGYIYISFFIDMKNYFIKNFDEIYSRNIYRRRCNYMLKNTVIQHVARTKNSQAVNNFIFSV